MGKKAKLWGLPPISLLDVTAGTSSKPEHGNADAASVNGVSRTVRKPERRDTATTTKRPWVAERSDAPVCNYSRKAKRIDGARWTPEFREEARNALRRDYVASSAKGPSASVLRAWEAMHRRMLGPDVPVYPLTPDKITQVAGAFKMCGYRSFSNYLTKAKEVQIQMYGGWCADLNLEARRATRSVARGIGPVTQRTPLRIERLMEARRNRQVGRKPLVEAGPGTPLHDGFGHFLHVARNSGLFTASCQRVR